MSNQNSIEVFNKTSVSSAIIKNVVPAIAAMLMTIIYNLADTFFIGQTHDALQVTAASLASPVFLIYMAIGTMFGMGGTSVISRALGEGKKEYAKKVCSFCMWSCVIVGIITIILFQVFMDDILSLIGASSDTWKLAKSYLSIVVCCGPFVLISSCYSNILRAEGQSGKAMMGQIIGNVLNIILDPIMILGFGWNVAGAAIATVIGYICGAGYYIWYFLKGNSMLSINIKDFTVKNKVCKNVLIIGIPAALGALLMSVSQIIVNVQMAEYGDMAIAGMGVALKVVMITGMICMGLGQGIQPLLGYCVGAKTWERFKKIFKTSILYALVLGIVLTAVCYLFVNQIVSVFLTDITAFDYAVRFAKILMTTSFLFGVFYVLIYTLQAMGAATASLIANLSRQGIIFIPVLLILKSVSGLNGIIWAQPVADILAIVLAVMLYARTYKTMKAETEKSIR